MPKVWNKRDSKTPDDAVYVGRPTIFGNPFSHLPQPTLAQWKAETRETAVQNYEFYARERLEKDQEFRNAVIALHGKDLVCWCAPQICHAEILLKLANELNCKLEPLHEHQRPGVKCLQCTFTK